MSQSANHAVRHESDYPANRGYHVIRRERTGQFGFLPHYHDSVEIIAVSGADGVVRIEGNEYPTSTAGDLALLIPPRMVHSLSFRGIGDRYRQDTVRISRQCLSDMLRGVSRYSREEIGRWVDELHPVSNAGLTADIMRHTGELSLCHDPHWGLKPAYPAGKQLQAIDDLTCLCRIVLLLLRTSPERRHVALRGSKSLSRIVDVVQHHYGDDLSVARLSRLCAVSPSHLCRLFRRQMNMTVKEYVNAVRIEHAKQAIRSGERNMSRLALLCGYRHPSYFTRVFTALEGVPPSRWRGDQGLPYH